MNQNNSNLTFQQTGTSRFDGKIILLATVIIILIIGLVPVRLLTKFLFSTPTPTPETVVNNTTTPTLSPSPSSTATSPKPTVTPTSTPKPEPTSTLATEPEPTATFTPTPTAESPEASFTPPDNPTSSPTLTNTPPPPTPTIPLETPAVVVAQPCPVILTGPADGASFSSAEEIKLEWESPEGNLGPNDFYRVSFRNASGTEIDAFVTQETSSVKEGNPFIAGWPRPDGQWLPNVRQGDNYKWTVAVQSGEDILCEAEEVRSFTWRLN